MTTTFEDIYSSSLLSSGKFRLAASGLGWKSSDEKHPVQTIPSQDLKYLSFSRVARGYQLKLTTLKGDKMGFDGFQKGDYDRLNNLTTQFFGLTITQKEVSVRGWNWGIAEVQSSDLAFLVQGRTAFDLPLSRVLNTTITKAEVALEFSPAHAAEAVDPNEDAVSRKKRLKNLPDEISELRLYVPGSQAGMKKKASKAKATAAGEDVKKSESDEEQDDEEDDEDEDGETAAQTLYDLIKDQAEGGKVQGEVLCTIPDVLCQTPRGRFEIDLHPTFLRLRGKTYDYRILYSSVQKLFLLPKPDDIHYNLVVNLDPPIRQGQTRYPFLVMQFAQDDMLELEVNATDEELEERYEGLKKHFDDRAYEVVSLLFRVLTTKKITTPGAYQSHEGLHAVKCNVKANEGLLYILERQMLFISKSPLNVALSDVHSVTLARLGGALPTARTFDLVVKTKSDPDHPTTFSSVNREEMQNLQDFLKGKKVRVKNEMEELAAVEKAMLGDDDDDDDDEMDVDDGPSGKIGDDDSDEEDDGDFKAESESDVAEEFDSNAGSDDDSAASSAGSSEDEKPAKKKAKRSDD